MQNSSQSHPNFYKTIFIGNSSNGDENNINISYWLSSTPTPPKIYGSGNNSSGGSGGSGGSNFPGKTIIIPLYSLIFLLSVLGNVLVILTLARNRRMVTVTNVFLLNLAISDLLLGVFCMPFTLIGQLLQNFIFGWFMCKVIPYFQAVSVSVGVWTLVSISIERYFAICRPLHSRKWQTKSHAYKTILVVWIITLLSNLPIASVTQLQPIRETGRSKCREVWPSDGSEKIFTLFLDGFLLVLPLFIMGVSYSLVVSKLWKGLRAEALHSRPFTSKRDSLCSFPSQNSLELSCQSFSSGGGTTATLRPSSLRPTTGTSNEILMLKGGRGVVVRWRKKDPVVAFHIRNLNNVGESGILNRTHTLNHRQIQRLKRAAGGESSQTNSIHGSHESKGFTTPSGTTGPERRCQLSRAIRSTYSEKSMEAKRKVIRMLFVLVAEFFICWSPLYVVHTWYILSPEGVYQIVGPLGVTLVQLLAYTSSCTHPITYCFMNKRFQQAFLKFCQCDGLWRSRNGDGGGGQGGIPTVGRGSEMLSANDSLIYAIPGTTLNKSEVMVLEGEESPV